MEAVAAGATGYLQKYSGKDRLLNTVRDVAQGEYRLPADVIRRVFAGIRGTAQSESGHRSEEADRAGCKCLGRPARTPGRRERKIRDKGMRDSKPTGAGEGGLGTPSEGLELVT